MLRSIFLWKTGGNAVVRGWFGFSEKKTSHEYTGSFLGATVESGLGYS